MQIPNSLKKRGIEQAVEYLSKDPEANLPKLMEWADQFASGAFAPQRDAIRAAVNDPDNIYHQLLLRILRDVDREVLKTTFVNFILNANLIGWPKQEAARQAYGCNVPWAILLDPNSACNLHCTGCWAAEYGSRLHLTYEEIDGIIRQGKELGIYMYIYTGGEPLVRKKDLMRLCRAHSDCQFLCFTNATLIDEAFVGEMLRVGNFIPAISLEGDEAATDSRRGAGTYRKVLAATELLKRKKLPFGFS